MTIKDIARISGFGVSTVSRALNGHADISEQTRQKIQDIVKEYNFVPNSNAKILKQSCGKDTLIIINGTQNMFFPLIVERIQPELDRRGIKAVFHYLDERDEELAEASRLVIEQKPQGVIFLGGNASHFHHGFDEINVPAVLCTANAAELGYSNLASVCIDDIKEGRKAVDYLYSMGHRKIGLITGTTEGKYAANDRLNGCLQSLKAHGLADDESWYEQTRFSLDGGYSAAKKLYERHNDITAVFAMSDIMAVGAMRAFQDMGLNVPQDISVMGIDGLPMTQFTNPRLTTLRQPVEQLAALSVKLLSRQLSQNQKATHELLDTELLEGGSVQRI